MSAPKTTVIPAEPTGEPTRASRIAGLWRLEPGMFIGIGVFALIALFVLIAPLMLPSPTDTDPVNRLLPPSPEHPLGTDGFGRDQLARLAEGGRASLGLVLCVTLATMVCGGTLGLISGYFPKAGAVIMRVMDAWMAFPSIVLAMLLAVTFGPSFWTVFVALLIIFTPANARMIRSRVLEVSQQNYVEAARSSGVGAWKILGRHVLPNVLPLALVNVVISAAASMLADGGLSFLGLGIAPPTPTWGNMISEGQVFLRTEPWLVVAPGLMIAVCVFLLNTVGNGLRSVVDPRYRSLRELQYAQAHRGVTRRAPRAGRA